MGIAKLRQSLFFCSIGKFLSCRTETDYAHLHESTYFFTSRGAYFFISEVSSGAENIPLVRDIL